MGFYSHGTGRPGPPFKNGRIRRHPNDVVLNAIRLCATHSTAVTAEITGVKYFTIRTWNEKRFLPATGPYRYESVMQVIRVARTIYLQSHYSPVTCVVHALRRFPKLRWVKFKQYLYFEAMPTIPGFPLYADRKVNAAAELYGLGRRRYGHVLGIDHPRIPAEVPKGSKHSSQSGRASAPVQKGRRFLVEVAVSRKIPTRKRHLL